MKKYIVLVLFLAFLVVTPVLAQDNSALIAQLKAKIVELTAQLNQLLAQQRGGFCYNFNFNLRQGDKHGDWNKLEQVLQFEGVSSVKELQEKYKDNILTPAGLRLGTGYVGSFTRAWLNNKYGCKNNSNLPVINRISGPTTLNIGQQGTWSVRVTDPQNGNINYFVIWGDEVGTVPTGANASQRNPAQQEAAFTHAYSRAGNYAMQVTATNDTGKSARASLTVNVGNQTTASITVTSPNGGERWVAKSVQDIKWNSTVYCDPAACRFDLYLDRANPVYCVVGPCPNSFVLNKNIDPGGVYHWIVATDIDNHPISNVPLSAGDYRVRICLAGSTTNCDSSDAPFTITPTRTSGITVTSPNGGESWAANSTQGIKWNDPTLYKVAPKYDLYLDYYDVSCPPGSIVCTEIYRPVIFPYVLDKNIPGFEYNWIVATDIVNKAIPVGTYLVRICPAGSTTDCDQSDAPFTITAATTAGTCYIGGCSGEICSDQPNMVSTCQYRGPICSLYSTCARQANGQCGWTQTSNLPNYCVSR